MDPNDLPPLHQYASNHGTGHNQQQQHPGMYDQAGLFGANNNQQHPAAGGGNQGWYDQQRHPGALGISPSPEPFPVLDPDPMAYGAEHGVGGAGFGPGGPYSSPAGAGGSNYNAAAAAAARAPNPPPPSASLSTPSTPFKVEIRASAASRDGARAMWDDGLSDVQCAQLGEDLARNQLRDPSLVHTFRVAAIIARYAEGKESQVAIDAAAAAGLPLTPEEETYIREEVTNRWCQPKKMYLVAVGEWNATFFVLREVLRR
jgi:hypothetical protein